MRKTSLIRVLFLCALILPAISAADDKVKPLFSHGAGPTEVLVFTDYFCPPCRKIEPYLETALEELHRLNVKITFVDKPIHKITPLFSKYFLYSSKASANFTDILRIRRELFDIASTTAIHSERDLLQALRGKNIAYALINTAPVFDRWSQLIRQYKVQSTPTCIVLKPGQQEIRYTGSRDIPAGIGMLIKELTQGT